MALIKLEFALCPSSGLYFVLRQGRAVPQIKVCVFTCLILSEVLENTMAAQEVCCIYFPMTLLAKPYFE